MKIQRWKMLPSLVIRQFLTSACMSRNDCDLKFILRDGVSVAHKIIILPVLADMSELFCNACIDNHEDIVIVLPDINKEHFDEARDFLYMFGDGSKIARILGANRFHNGHPVANLKYPYNIDIVDDNFHDISESSENTGTLIELKQLENYQYGNSKKNAPERYEREQKGTDSMMHVFKPDEAKVDRMTKAAEFREAKKEVKIMLHGEVSNTLLYHDNVDDSQQTVNYKEHGIVEENVDEEIRVKVSRTVGKLQEDTKINIKFSCEKCEFSSDTMYHLDIHKKKNHCFRTNPGASSTISSMSFDCKKCSYVGKAKKYLASHMYLIHSEPKVCKKCNFSTSSQNMFKRHRIKYHEGGLPQYHCDDCKYQTDSKSALKQHCLATHAGLRYKCEECEYLATTKQSLKLHNESYHIGIRYFCDKCELQAKTMAHLRRHKREKHREDVPKQFYPQNNKRKNSSRK